MQDYLNMEILRDRSAYPTGMKHYSKDTIVENNLFDINLIGHKVKGILKGEDYEQKDERKVCEGISEQVLPGDRDSSDSAR